jgi:hypothetical protein
MRLSDLSLGWQTEFIGHRLDAMVAPTAGPAWLIDPVNGDAGTRPSATSPAAVAGNPHVTVPIRQVARPGSAFGTPVGLSFFGTAWQDARLLALALHCEQATRHRAPRRAIGPAAPDARARRRAYARLMTRSCRADKRRNAGIATSPASHSQAAAGSGTALRLTLTLSITGP